MRNFLQLFKGDKVIWVLMFFLTLYSGVAVASSALLGAKTSCISPVPKPGRFTRSPGEVKRSCSIICRMWGSSAASAVRPRPSMRKG